MIEEKSNRSNEGGQPSSANPTGRTSMRTTMTKFRGKTEERLPEGVSLIVGDNIRPDVVQMQKYLKHSQTISNTDLQNKIGEIYLRI